ncbi:MAG: alpha/beta hydrolase [Cyanobacteria bacterium P01_H01_bin.153]
MASRTIPHIDFLAIETQYHMLADGRALAFSRYGKAGGTPVYYFHGCPGSRWEAAPCHDWAQALGFEIFALDRPGCGRSSRASAYRMLDWPRDVIDFANHQSHERFGVIGLSGGGAYIQACAYTIADRLRFAYDLAGWAPVAQVEELRGTLAPLDRFFLQVAVSCGFLFQLPFALLGLAAKHLSDRGFANLLRSSMSDDDKAFIFGSANNARFFRSIVRESFAQGSHGPASDAMRCYRDWGFRLSDIEYPVRIWHGTDDHFASFRFAQYKHRVITGSSLRVFEGRGHLHLVTEYEALFKDMQQH